MHSVERDDLKRWMLPYLTLDAEGEDWRGGYFKVKEGPTLRDSKDRVSSIRWEKKNGSGPREVREVLIDLESAIDLITMESHDRVWVVAYVKGDNNPSSWLPVAAADGMGQGHHSGEMESALTQRMSRGGGAPGDILSIALARMGMGAQAQLQEMTEKYVAALEQLAGTAAENKGLRMLLEGSLALQGSDRSERMFELLQTFAPHVGPHIGAVLSQVAASVLPNDLPSEPGARADHHLQALKTNLLALAALMQAEPVLLTPERQAAIAELIQLVQSWQAPAAE